MRRYASAANGPLRLVVSSAATATTQATVSAPKRARFCRVLALREPRWCPPRPGLSSYRRRPLRLARAVESRPAALLPGMSAAGGWTPGRAMSSHDLPDYALRDTGESRHAPDDTDAGAEQHVVLQHRRASDRPAASWTRGSMAGTPTSDVDSWSRPNPESESSARTCRRSDRRCGARRTCRCHRPPVQVTRLAPS